MEAFNSNTLKLDEEFKQGLQSIRGYLVNLTSPHAARCCGEWLQKLRNSSDERELRNVLLQRLVSQVQTRKLEYPFDRIPTDKPLYKLYEEGDASSWCTDDFETSTKGTVATSAETGYCMKEDGGGDTYRNVPDRIWYDLPDHRQPVSEGPLHDPYRIHATSCIPIKSDNDHIKKVQNECSERDARNQKETERSTNLNIKMQNEHDKKTSLEVEKLTSCIEEYKNLLTDYKRVVNDNITDLSERLETVIENNQIQKSDLKTLQTSLHDSWTAKLQSLESELLTEVSKLECQLASDRSKYEAKIEHLKQVILEKDEKINSLDSKMKQQAASLKEKMNSVRDEITLAAKENDYQFKKKYSFMKKQLVNLENINKELIKQHEKNIILTVKDYEAKVKSAKLLGADESMMELEDKISQLEKHYQTIFQQYKRKIDENRSKESRRIHFEDLESLIKDK